MGHPFYGCANILSPQKAHAKRASIFEAKDCEEYYDSLIRFILLLLLLFCYVHFSMFTRVTGMYIVLNIDHGAGRCLISATPIGDHG